MKAKYLLSAVVLGAIFTASGASAASYVVDGDFAGPWGGSSFVTYSSGSSLGPWTVTGTGSGPDGVAGVDLIGNYWQAPAAGEGSVDLDGNAPGGISQTISGLIAGETYILDFELSGNPDGASATKTVDVSIGNENEVFTYTLNTSSTESNMQYVSEQLQFTAGALNTLAFASQDGAGSPFGAVVGNVSIVGNLGAPLVPVPEPSSWAMMGLGFASLAFAGFRSRRAAISAA